MKLITNQQFVGNGLFKLKNKDYLIKQRIAGKVAAKCLMMLEQEVKDKTTKSLIELSDMAESIMLKENCSATFKGYKFFPAAVCISVNKQLVHGIPTDYKLQEGDVVKFDLGATFEGAIADTAITCIYGEPKPGHAKMVAACYESLMKGIKSIAVGKKIGVIGDAVYKSAKGNGFNVITNYGGHGIDISEDGVGIPHAAPFISNKDSIDNGFRIQPGLVIAIEPLLVLGNSTQTSVSKDGWTVLTQTDVNCHVEHSLFIHDDHVEVITWRENETLAKINEFGVFNGNIC